MTDAGAAMGGYRYALFRDIDCNHEGTLIKDCPGQPKLVVFIMLNPSTATAEQDDATIRRCIGFARSWPGYGKLTVLNLFAFRATRPKALKLSADPIGKLNNDAIYIHTDQADLIVCAWGVHGALYDRGEQVVKGLQARGLELHCLGLTKDGHPRHPLYVAGNTEPIPFRTQE